MRAIASEQVNWSAQTVRIRFDDWGEYYDYEAEWSSRDLHPCGYSTYANVNFYPPQSTQAVTFS